MKQKSQEEDTFIPFARPYYFETFKGWTVKINDSCNYVLTHCSLHEKY